ncbi:MAG: hypothetical protein ABEL76_02555 [Bradymonadaceae bacterium]
MPSCPACEQQLEIDEGALAVGSITCPACDRMFELDDDGTPVHDSPFEESSGSLVRHIRSRDEPVEPEETIPATIHLRETDDRLHLARSWNRLYGTFMLSFAGLGAGVCWVIASAFEVEPASAAFWLALLPGIVVLGAVAYLGLCFLLNETRLTIDPSSEKPALNVEYGPLPWPGATSIPLWDVRQIYASTQAQHDSVGELVVYFMMSDPTLYPEGHAPHPLETTAYFHHVRAQRPGDRPVTLFRGVDRLEADAICDVLRKYLGTEGLRVPDACERTHLGGAN